MDGTIDDEDAEGVNLQRREQDVSWGIGFGTDHDMQ